MVTTKIAGEKIEIASIDQSSAGVSVARDTPVGFH